MPERARTLLLADLGASAPEALAELFGWSVYEAAQRTRRMGWQVLRIGAEASPDELAALRHAGAQVRMLAEQELWAARRPWLALGGHWRGGRLYLRVLRAPRADSPSALPVAISRLPAPESAALPVPASSADERVFELGPGELLLVVRGRIAREWHAPETGRRQRRLVSPEPGARWHLHLWHERVPLELDPQHFEFGPEGAGAAAAVRFAGWVEALAPARTVDDGFRLLAPALAPAAAEVGTVAALAGTLRTQVARAGSARALLDNLAQFRFYSAWRGALERQAGTPDEEPTTD